MPLSSKSSRVYHALNKTQSPCQGECPTSLLALSPILRIFICCFNDSGPLIAQHNVCFFLDIDICGYLQMVCSISNYQHVSLSPFFLTPTQMKFALRVCCNYLMSYHYLKLHQVNSSQCIISFPHRKISSLGTSALSCSFFLVPVLRTPQHTEFTQRILVKI